MKRKSLAILLGLTMTVTPSMAYAEDTSETVTEVVTEAATDTQADASDEDTSEKKEAKEDTPSQQNQVRGEVSEVGDNTITLVNDETKESETYTLADDVKIEKSAGMGPGGDGQEPPSKPEGENGGDQSADAAPEKPEGEGSNDQSADAAPEKPEGEGSNDQSADAAPEKPEGENGGDQSADVAPEKPEGEDGGEQSADAVPEKPEGEGGGQGNMEPMQSEEITLSDIQAGDTVTLTLNDDGTVASISVQSDDMGGGMQGGSGGPGGASQGVDSYDAVNTIEEDTEISDQSIESTGADENAVHVTNGAKAELEDVTISRNSSDSTGGDNSSFYGVGAAVLATDGTVTVEDSTITTDSAGGAGVFAYGDGVAYVEDSTIETKQDTSGGIHVAGGGTLYAWDNTVTTNGNSAAAVRSDRGGGTMVVDGGTYTSNGTGSPAVYCTADISINDATLTATGSEAVCIEGLNTLRLYDCDLSGNMSDDEQNDNTWTVIVYQSMSGDSEVGNGVFQMKGGKLTSGNGGLFYTTNTESTITLENVEIEKTDDSEFFLQCTGNSNARGWGNSGANGADCVFTGISQVMDGDIVWDSISDLDLYLTEGSTLTGAITQDETWAGNGGDGYCNVTVSSDSKWIVTGDSKVSTLSTDGVDITDDTGLLVTIQGSDGTVYVEGDSAYTITVDSYNTTADLSGASTTDTWEAHEVDEA